MNPFYPQDAPQEFFTFHTPFTSPTRTPAWFSLVEQLLNIPLLYVAQFEASTVTDTGCFIMASVKALQSFTSVKPDTLNGFVQFLQV